MKQLDHKKSEMTVWKALLPCFFIITAAFLAGFYRLGIKEGIARAETLTPGSASGQSLAETGTGTVVTPQQFGALADGIHDDGPALQKALESGNPVVLVSDLYLFSKVSVWDHNVSLNGNGYVLHCDGGVMEICASLNQDPSSDVAIITENQPYYGTYYRGYISYHGSKPLAENLEHYTASYFNEYHAYISNLTILARNCQGSCGLELKRMCKSTISNVSSICEEGSDGEVGILVYNCYQVRIENCYAQNWTATNTGDRGYGIGADGNDITVIGCSAFGNKHDISICTARNIFSNDITVNNCKVGCSYQPEAYRHDGSKRFQARFDIHAAGERVTVHGLKITVDHADQGTILAAIRAPKVEISQVEVEAADGYLVFAELADSVYFTDLQMEACDLHGGLTKEESIDEIHITNGVINGFDQMGDNTKIYLQNVMVKEEPGEGYQIIR